MSYLPPRHTNTDSDQDGITIYFALENINKKKHRDVVAWNGVSITN
jgi:hypothetical protein